ncbi:MAG: ABC transporter permease [Spirochaetia bacterium]|nr:ABC transporter permease [Spirochaetia bacterium]
MKKIQLKKNDATVLTIIMFAVLILMVSINQSAFLSLNNVQSMAFQLPELGLFALAMMVVMLTGGINLSIIATANMSGITAALILTNSGDTVSAGTIFLAVSAAFAVSAVIGIVNGSLVAYVGITPILATLGTMTLLNGITIVVTKGYVISGFPDAVRFIGNGTIAAIPFPLLIFAAMAFLMSIILNKTTTGFSMYMLGSNETAAKFSGINNPAVIVRTYLISGLYSGAASLVMISRFNSARAGYGDSYLLVAILAVVLGGVDNEGGFGKVSGVIISLVTLQMISSGLNLMRVSSFMTTAIWGIIMIAVMVINFLIDRRKGGSHV